jgi:aryl-alcohol dehydrogenase-like predicted oxidoreductase
VHYRRLGRTDLEVSVLGMGCSRLGSFWQKRPDHEGKATVRRALERGVNLFETADSYAFGRSESLLGHELRPHRDSVIIVTKCGYVRTPRAVVAATWSERRDAHGPAGRLVAAGRALSRLSKERRCYSPAYIVRATEGSLRRLRTEHLDVLLVHSPPQEVLKSGEFVEGLDLLKTAGKVRYVGLSLRSIDDLPLLHAHEIDCMEVELNACSSVTDRERVDRVAAGGVGVLARQPFKSGNLLSAGGRDDRAIAGALQFPLHQPSVTCVLAGMGRKAHVDANVDALEGKRASHGELEVLRRRLCGPTAS